MEKPKSPAVATLTTTLFINCELLDTLEINACNWNCSLKTGKCSGTLGTDGKVIVLLMLPFPIKNTLKL